MAPDKRLERPEDGSLSPAAGDATAPAAQTPELGPEPPPPSDATRRDPGRGGRERRWEGSPQEAATKETHSPTRSRGAGGDIPRRRRRAVGARGGGGVGGERGTSERHRRLPRPPSPEREREREGGREGGAGKAKPGERCSENKAGLWKADADTRAQEQERKRRRHARNPHQEKTQLNLGRDRDKVRRQQTQARAGGWGKCT